MTRNVVRERRDDDLPENPRGATRGSASQADLFEEILADDGAEERESSGSARRHRPARRRGRRGIVVLLVLVVVLIAGAVGAEYLVRGQVDAAVRSALPGLSSDARIATRGIVLRQLVSGSLDSLTVDAKSLEITPKGGGAGEGGQTVTLRDVDVDLGRISLRSPYPTQTVTASGTIGWQQVAALAAQQHPKMQGMTLQAQRTGTSAQEPGAIRASASLLGISGEAEIVPSVGDDGSLVLTITSTRMGGEPVGADVAEGQNSLLSYVGLDSPEIRIPASSLPQGLRPSSVIVTNEGLRLSLSGQQVNLGQL